jgi:hypothetical protein
MVAVLLQFSGSRQPSITVGAIGGSCDEITVCKKKESTLSE